MWNWKSYRCLMLAGCVWMAFSGTVSVAGPDREIRAQDPSQDSKDLAYLSALTLFADDVKNGHIDRRSDALGLFFRPDLAKLLRAIDVSNEINHEGAFQVFYYDGLPSLTYVSQGKSYYLEKDGSSTRIRLGPSALEKTVIAQGFEPDVLKKRFLAPSGWVLVGLETNLYGSILPLFSDRRGLLESRVPAPEDQAHYEHWLMLDVLREVNEYPLYLTPHIGQYAPSAENGMTLPQELLDLIARGQTLTTEASLRYRALFDANTPAELILSPYAIHMVMNQWMSGRSGFLAKDGVPLLTKSEGQEFFVEIKGDGVAMFNPSRTSLQERWSSRHRSGRISRAWMMKEFAGYDLLNRMRTQSELERRLLSRPAVGVVLPEHYTEDLPWSANLEAAQTSAQLYRLSTSTRRAAYGQNIVYGGLYNTKKMTMSRTQASFGRLMGDLWVREPHYRFHSPHAQNFVSYPIHGLINPTDLGEVELGTGVPFFPQIDEVLIFRSLDGRRHFLRGLNGSLEPRGLWRPSLEVMRGVEFSQDEICRMLMLEFGRNELRRNVSGWSQGKKDS